MEAWHLVVWLMIGSPVLVHGEVKYLSQKGNDSVALACSSPESNPYGVYLRRKWLQPDTEVLFIHKDAQPKFRSRTDQNRIQVVENLGSGQLDVTISHLQGSDTDLYVCEFMFESIPTDRKEPGRDQFLLYVADHVETPCNCSDYRTLLYIISGAVGLLLLIIVGLTVTSCSTQSKVRNGSKPQPAVPIYEEMTGLKSGNHKPLGDLGRFGESEHLHNENPYSTP